MTKKQGLELTWIGKDARPRSHPEGAGYLPRAELRTVEGRGAEWPCSPSAAAATVAWAAASYCAGLSPPNAVKLSLNRAEDRA